MLLLMVLKFQLKKNSLIQKPEPVKEITMEELEKHFGSKVKIKE